MDKETKSHNCPKCGGLLQRIDTQVVVALGYFVPDGFPNFECPHCIRKWFINKDGDINQRTQIRGLPEWYDPPPPPPPLKVGLDSFGPLGPEKNYPDLWTDKEYIKKQAESILVKSLDAHIRLAWNKFVKLYDKSAPDDLKRNFRDAIHQLQLILFYLKNNKNEESSNKDNPIS